LFKINSDTYLLIYQISDIILFNNVVPSQFELFHTMNVRIKRFSIQLRIIAFGWLLFSFTLNQAQISRPGHPYPVKYKGLKEPFIYDLQVSAKEKSKVFAMQKPSLLKPACSGLLIDVNMDLGNAGNWDTLSNGLKIWRAGFHVEGAALLNVLFNPYHIKKGVKIFLYDFNQQTILGAFTDLNNKDNLVMPTAHITGDLLIVEVQVPQFVDSPGELTISQIGCDFSSYINTQRIKDGWYGLSGDCNADINCYKDSIYQIVKNAVVQIVFLGTERCTGALINNTSKNGRNYILTAEHCISTERNANSAVFYFQYESPYCNGPDGNRQKSISGATLRATIRNLDFSLLELLEPVPFTYHPFYAGWNKSGLAPSSGFTIHHPQGDVKKISFENHGITIGNFGNQYDDHTHWLVSHWETGTTEAGSSGGPLFNQNSHIVGTLTGGEADCENPVNDYFQMISHSWNDYDPENNQLEYWLDPSGEYGNTLDGFDPYAAFWKTGDTLTNILPNESLSVENKNLLWGSLSGHNSDYIKQFAEQFKNSAKKRVLGIILNVADNYFSTSSSHMKIKIWQGELLPANPVYEKQILLADLSNNALNFIEFDSIITAPANFYAGYELFYEIPQDTFSVYVANNRIMVRQLNTAYVNDGNQWQSLDSYTEGEVYSSFSIMPVVFDSVPEDETPFDSSDDIIVYPNPANNEIWLQFRKMVAEPTQLNLFNMQGQQILSKEYGAYQQFIHLDLDGLSSGLYIVSTKRGTIVNNLKIVVLKQMNF
jgi:lysyl endopeptidase